MRRWWQSWEWPTIWVLAGISVLIGWAGFEKQFGRMGLDHGPLDSLYSSLQLFVLEFGNVQPPVCTELQVARILSPMVAGYTAAQALTVIFVTKLDELRLSRKRGHVVVCGSGSMALRMVQALRQRGEEVVLIVGQTSDSICAQCREQRATIVTGVPSEPDCLRRAGVHRATCVVAVDEDDVANAALLQQVRALADSTRQSPLACAVHIGDLQLRRQLRSREIARAGRIRLQFINIFDDAAVRLLRTHPLFNDICLRADRDPHLLVVGHGGMLEALVYHAADGWRERAVGGNARLRITIVDPRASSVVELWHRRHAGLSSLCDLCPVDVEFPSAEFEQLPSVTDATTMVVRLDTAARTLSAALSLHRQGRGRRVPVIACPDHEAGLASLLRLDADFELFAELHMFGVYDQGLDPDLLPGRTIERLAQLLHQDYVASQCDAGRTPADNPALAPWDELSEELRESNRLEAEFIGLRLSAAGYGIEPLTGFSGAAVEFTEEEIDLMARLEHRRWMAERLLEGWRPGPERDDERKVNPNLRPWDELTPEMKEYNLQSTRALPALLARAGLQVYREESGVSPA